MTETAESQKWISLILSTQVTIIQWYRVLNSQKYEQIYTGKTHPQQKHFLQNDTHRRQFLYAQKKKNPYV
ncbi:hypothetical protein XELAEV_18007819mg [Xenopus laevis]|uniref:Uncharacterized protein n=1 Tax=Xenopus laevis TaxID=8355 RepID=A0A974E3L0_XENLA|nr:hypothetical protein XELAEV_18007819mg [Xenopus laevis]